MVCSRASSFSPELFLQGWQLVKVRLRLSFKKGFWGAKWIVRAPLPCPELFLQGWQKKNVLVARKNVKTKPTTRGIPRRSPILVLTTPERV